MTDATLRAIVFEAAASAFEPAIIEEAYRAATAVAPCDDPAAYASQVGEAVRRVLAGAVAIERTTLRRDTAIQLAIARAWSQELGVHRH